MMRRQKSTRLQWQGTLDDILQTRRNRLCMCVLPTAAVQKLSLPHQAAGCVMYLYRTRISHQAVVLASIAQITPSPASEGAKVIYYYCNLHIITLLLARSGNRFVIMCPRCETGRWAPPVWKLCVRCRSSRSCRHK